MNWRNAGIIPVFPIGSSGPGSGTAGTPGNSPIVIGVSNGPPATGPASDQSFWNNPQYWMRPDWNLTKPDISAPGVNVYSSLPGGSYENMSGTSRASPHVAGAIAIIRQKNPEISIPEVYNLLLDYSDKPSQCSLS